MLIAGPPWFFALEKLPESLLGAVEDLGHEIYSVNHLKLKGLDNATLYQKFAATYERRLTRDAGFAANVRRSEIPRKLTLLRVIVPRQRVESFVPALIDAIQKSDCSERRIVSKKC